MAHIVHLSDLHFYNHSNWNNMRRCLIRTLREKAASFTEGNIILIITGDFHNFGENYDDAKKLIKDLVKVMKLDITNDVFVVPGNHDKKYSDDEKTKKRQMHDIAAAKADYKELQDDSTIEMLLEPFALYGDFCKELGIYPNDDSIPAAIHVRTWNDKLNIMHLNTALAADGKIKEDQLLDIKTLTSLDFTDSIPEGLPAIAIGHNAFFDLHDRIQVEATPVFDDQNVCAYLCGDKHKFNEKRIEKTIPLSSSFNPKGIPNIVCGKCTTDEDDQYSDFGFYIHYWNEDTGWVNLEKYTWDDKNEQNDFIVSTDKKAYRLLSEIDIDPDDLNKLSTINTFTKQLQKLSAEDGMMKCLETLFQKQITDNKLSIAELKILSMVQDKYNSLYDKYYTEEKDIETEEIDRILSDKTIVKMENNIHTNPLIITYFQFVKADRKYFTKDREGAIHDYKEAYDKIHDLYRNNEMPRIDKERCAYLLNSIAWTYKLLGDIKAALQWYGKLFDEFIDIDTYAFSWRYRRNYGVCFENIKDYVEAINQYEKVIENIAHNNSNIHEYKIYLTYCSAMMKYWDFKTGKTSGEWINKVRETYKQGDDYLNDDKFLEIYANLKLANDKYKVLDTRKLLSDYHNQLSKVWTYKMIIVSENSDISKLSEEIEKNLKITVKNNANAGGYHYIKRDFYYALYEITQDKKYYKIAWDENEQINGHGDAIEFREMLEKK